MAAQPVGSVEITIPNATLQIGQTTAVVAVAKSSFGATLTGRTFAWSSSSESVATVSQSGVVTAVSTGETNITVTSEGKSANGTITVVPIPVASVQLSATTASIVVGVTTTITATPRAADNSALTGRTVTWTSENAAIATVDVTPAVVPLVVGNTATLTVTLRDATGVVLTDRTVVWNAMSPAVATVAAGVVTAVAPGTATIRATSEGKEGTAQITVSAPPLISDGRRAVGAGMEQTCALDTMRKAWCWGRNANGNIGNGTDVRIADGNDSER